jgi:hypothetical protein
MQTVNRGGRKISIPEEYPRVTDILARAGLIKTEWFTDEGMILGIYVHRAAHYSDQGALKPESIDPKVLPRLRQYWKFLEEKNPELIEIELPVVNHVLRYRGTPDRVVIIDGREGILDLKSPGVYPWQSIQLSMYANCFDRAMARWSLHLHDERYILKEHRNRDDWKVAKAAITLAAWKEGTNGRTGN